MPPSQHTGFSDIDQVLTPTLLRSDWARSSPAISTLSSATAASPAIPTSSSSCPPPSEPDLHEVLAEGCFVVIGADGVTADDTQTPVYDPGYANGRIYRIGNRRTDLNDTNDAGSQAWELMPGHDMQSAEENLPLRKQPTCRSGLDRL